MKTTILFFALFCVLSTAIPFIKSDLWWIRMFDFPLAQLAGLTVIGTVMMLFIIDWSDWRESLLLAILVIASTYHAYRIFPYTQFSAYQVQDYTVNDDDASISILSANVLMSNRDSSRLLKVINQQSPDILIFLEADAWWQKQFDIFRDKYVYSVEKPLDNTYGMILLSKLELVNPSIQYLVEADIPSIHTEVILPSGIRCMLYSIHPTPPSPTENQVSTERDAELLIVAKLAAQKDMPSIVAGDLNDVAWSHTTRLFQKISRMLDPRIGRGMFNTFHAKYPFFRWPLDHVFHSDHFKVATMKRLPYTGSDHFPIFIKLQYESAAVHQQEAPKADAEDRAVAKEKIEEVGVDMNE